MTKKVQEWCAMEMKNVLYHGYDASKATDRCYGIVMFVLNSVHGYDTPEGRALANWWEDEMLPWFNAAVIYQNGAGPAPETKKNTLL